MATKSKRCAMRTNEALITVLEYCGGSRTDELVARLRYWNPTRALEVIDNASPTNRCGSATRRNVRNSFVGGGIKQCFSLARQGGYSSVLFVANDVVLQTPIRLQDFLEALRLHPKAVQISASVTRDSAPQSDVYPWMVSQAAQGMRIVPHADLLCCLVQTEFIDTFGGFPQSKWGWGFDWEIAYQARLRNLDVGVLDSCVFVHQGADTNPVQNDTLNVEKRQEMHQVYSKRYGNCEWMLKNTLAAYWKAGVITMRPDSPPLMAKDNEYSIMGSSEGNEEQANDTDAA
jgi:hypothetical protein